MAWCVVTFCGVGVAAGLEELIRVWVKSAAVAADLAAVAAKVFKTCSFGKVLSSKSKNEKAPA